MSTHTAVVIMGARQPLQTFQVTTVAPAAGEVRIRSEWTASTPLDLHQADGALLLEPPYVMGGGLAGTVVELGECVRELKVGDKVYHS
jgi:Zn-dependent alcohol dehydrogenase